MTYKASQQHITKTIFDEKNSIHFFLHFQAKLKEFFTIFLARVLSQSDFSYLIRS